MMQVAMSLNWLGYLMVASAAFGAWSVFSKSVLIRAAGAFALAAAMYLFGFDSGWLKAVATFNK